MSTMVVLLVDSNAAARNARSAAMEQQGWRVFAADGEKSASAWLNQSDSLNLLISEAIFDANSTGFRLRDMAHKKFTGAKVVFTTRYDLAGFDSQVRDTPVVIDKPLSAEDLVSKVAAFVSSGPAAVQPPLLPAGTMLGNNQIIDRLYTEREAETYRALQRAVQRQVAMVVLKPELLGKPEVLQEFKERERIKASVNHPRIAPLFEAGIENGWHYYTREMPPGRSLEQVQAEGTPLGERATVDALFGVADAMSYATERGLHYRSLGARDIYIDTENQSSIVNIIRPATENPRDQESDVRALLAMFRPVVSEGKARGLLQSLTEEEHNWSGLLAALTELRGGMRDRSVIRKAEAAELIAPARPQGAKSGIVLWVLGTVSLIAAAWLGGFAGKGYQPPPKAQTSEMIEIPAGEFVYQQGDRKILPTYFISKYEVTVGEYATFLEALKKATPGQYDHPEQPPTKKDHTPESWKQFYAAAATGAQINGQALDLDSPISRVDWWDAYAYAKWKGQRLPTEEEWEKAARGPSGLIFPWGNDPNPAAANLGDDYDPKGETGGANDGFSLWAPVKKITKDATSTGVMGMAGNVEEWTSSWATHPELPDVRVPVVRGGHFGLKSSSQLLTRRYFADSASDDALARGFRTASNLPSTP
jgi:formylglycine-generating enzyme required for sulfatase activity/CheY-like chemotaxis protein